MTSYSSDKPATLTSVANRLEAFASGMGAGDGVADFEMTVGDDVTLEVRRHDGQLARVTMTSGTEVYFLELGAGYQLTRTAYDDSGKWEVLDDLLECCRLFLKLDYREELKVRSGRILARVLHLGDDYCTIAGPVKLSDRAKLALGYRRIVLNPSDKQP